MKASELRIGNWVKIKDSKGICTTVTKSTFDCDVDVFYKPIPITEKWLLKLGAKKLSDNFFDIGYLKFKIHSHQYGIDFHFGNGGKHYIKPHYVHSLQNLYFALTGEELTIK